VTRNDDDDDDNNNNVIGQLQVIGRLWDFRE
jgi:hypothetical protein